MLETEGRNHNKKYIPGGIFTVRADEDLTIVRANDYFYQLFGYTRDEAEQAGFDNLRHRTFPQDQEILKSYIVRSIKERKPELDIEFQGIHKNYSLMWLLARGKYDEETKEIKGVLLDVTKNKRKQEFDKIAELDQSKLELKKEFYRDPLTGLLNRKGIIEAFEALTDNQKEGLHGFFMIDIDNFKTHNDYGGHLFGDRILESISKELRSLFREQDIVGRLGGDEFIVILTGVPGEEALKGKAQSVNKKLELALENDRSVSISQGIALYPKDGVTFMELYKKADVALYQAKARGKNQYVLYSENPKTMDSDYSKDESLDFLPVDSVSAERKLHEELRETKEMYRWGLAKSQVPFWEYNINDNSFTDNQGEVFRSAENMVAAGKLHKDSIKEISRMGDEVKAGSKEGELFLKGRGPDGNFEWLKVSYRTFSGKEEEPLRIFAVAKVLPGETKSKTRYIREEWIKRELLDMGAKVYITNLSSNKLEPFKEKNTSFTMGLEDKANSTYEDLLNSIGSCFVKSGKTTEFKKAFSFVQIIENLNHGRDSIKEMVQMTDEKGRLIWVTIYNRTIIHPDTGDYYSYMYIKEDEEMGRRESASIEPLVKDPITGFYKEASLTKTVIKSWEQSKKQKVYGMIILDMVNYSSQRSQMGDRLFKNTFSRMAEDICLVFPSRYICAIKEKSELIILLEEDKNVSIKEVSEKYLKQFKSLFNLLDPKGKIMMYAGIASFSQGESYENLYEKAYMARNLATTGENWNYVFYGDKEKELQSEAIVLEESISFIKKGMTLVADGEDSPIEDKELVESCLLCVNNFIEKQDGETALFNACEILAKYYSAEEAFITEVKEGSAKQIRSLTLRKGESSLSRIDDFPDNFTYAAAFTEAYKRKEGFTAKNIMAVPFLIDGVFGGFVGVVRPSVRTNELRLLSTTSYIIGSGLYRMRLREGYEYHALHDIGTGLYNRNEYNRVLQSLHKEGISSLGVISLELNEQEDKNTIQGIKTFEGKVLQIAETIQSVCEHCSAYRVGEGQFIVLCKDSTIEGFMALSTKIQTVLALKSPGLASLGYCWSAEDVDVDRLLKHADELKRIDNLKYRDCSNSDQEENYEEDLDKLLMDIRSNRFTILIQPIIDARTGRTRGGEALVRKRDEEGFLHLPLEFIRRYEATRMIRYIDLFVLEEACKTIAGWISDNINPVPISVNFSRETLLEADIVSGLIIIAEKHNIPRKLIEIEVTERLGDVEESTIMEIAKSIKESGFGLSLDDFGTEYSNLSVVSYLKLDTLKIDRSLINQIHENKTTEVIIQTVLQLCKKLDIKSVAEGVESKFQIDALKSWGCDYLQGFYYSKALPAEDFKVKYLCHKDL